MGKQTLFNITNKDRNRKEFKVLFRGRLDRNENKFVTIDVDNETQIHYFPANIILVKKGKTDRDIYTCKDIIDIQINGKKLTLLQELKPPYVLEMSNEIKTVECWGDFDIEQDNFKFQ